MPEVDLYPPIKRFLEQQGYLVKGEIGACDLLAVRDEESPVIVELKENLNLALMLQAADRLAMSETVYLAFRVGKKHSAAWRTRRKRVINLLRRLGLGVLTVSDAGQVSVSLEPGPYQPRRNQRRQQGLLKEFSQREGDPEPGGSAARQRLTAYRQDALRCAHKLRSDGTLKLSVLRERTGVSRAGAILRDNHYGWFERVKTGYYALSPKGRSSGSINKGGTSMANSGQSTSRVM